MLAVVCGVGAAASLVCLPRLLADDPHLPSSTMLMEQCACACGLGFGIYILACLVGFGGYPNAIETCGPQKVFPAKESCSMAHPGMGLFMLALCGVMLYTRDNYLGIPTLVLYLCENVVVTYEEAYGPLHQKMGITGDTLTETVQEQGSSSELGSGSGAGSGLESASVEDTISDEELANNNLKTLTIS